MGSRRPRTLVLGLVGLAVVVILVATGTLLWDRHRSTRSWVFTHTVDLPGSVLEQRVVFARSSQSFLGLKDPAAACWVEVWSRDAVVQRPAGTTAVQVAGRPAAYAPPPPEGADERTGVYWTTPDNRPAQVSCESEDEPATSIRVAERVRVVAEPVRSPFRLTSLPADYQARVVDWEEGAEGIEADGDVLPQVLLETTRPDRAYTGSSILMVHRVEELGPMEASEPVTVGGRPGLLQPHPRRLCMSDIRVCVTDVLTDSSGYDTAVPADVRRLLIDVGTALEVAPEPADPETWFTGDEVLPG